MNGKMKCSKIKKGRGNQRRKGRRTRAVRKIRARKYNKEGRSCIRDREKDRDRKNFNIHENNNLK